MESDIIQYITPIQTMNETNTDVCIDINSDRVKELDREIELIIETYTEEQIIRSIPKESTPEKDSLEYVIPFVTTNILEKNL